MLQVRKVLSGARPHANIDHNIIYRYVYMVQLDVNMLLLQV